MLIHGITHKLIKIFQRENPKKVAPREALSFKTALTTNNVPITVPSTFENNLPQVKVKVKDGLKFDKEFEVDGKESEPYFEKFPNLTEDYQVSFNKPITILKEDGVVEIQPEVNFKPDINPIAKDELQNNENNNENLKGFHKF